MDFLTEFDGLPQELCEWGHNTIAEIKSPEKRHKVAAELRIHIDNMWEDNSHLDEKRRIQFILDNLGESSYISKQFAEEEKYDPYAKRRYMILAIILILIGIGCCVYAAPVIWGQSGAEVVGNGISPDTFTPWRTGIHAGAGMFAGIALLVVGIRILLLALKKE